MTFEVSKDVRPLITDRVDRDARVAQPAGRADRRHQGLVSRACRWPTGAYVKSGVEGGPLGDLTDDRVERASMRPAKLIADIRAGRGTLGKLVDRRGAVSRSMQRVRRRRPTAVAEASKEGKGTLGKLMKDPAAYNALKASLENLQTMTRADQRRQGPLGRLLNDDAMGKSLQHDD